MAGKLIKFDVSGSDPEKALAGGEPPKPGVYAAKVESVVLGYKKGDDGKPDKEQPRLEIIYRIAAKGPNLNWPLYDYIGFSEAQEWKYDQFLQAFGLATKTKRTGSFDPDKLKGKPCKIRVKGDTNPSTGEYSPKPGAVMPPGEETDEPDPDLLDEPDPEGEPEPDLEDEPDPDDLAEPPEPAEGEYTAESLGEMSLEDLKALAADEFEIDPLPKGKTKIIAAILEAQDNEEPF